MIRKVGWLLLLALWLCWLPARAQMPQIPPTVSLPPTLPTLTPIPSVTLPTAVPAPTAAAPAATAARQNEAVTETETPAPTETETPEPTPTLVPSPDPHRVREAQWIIRYLGDTEVQPTGVIDAPTRSALESFQGASDLQQSGTTDDDTMGRLHARIGEDLKKLGYADLAAFQSSHGLQPDGVFGAQSFHALREANAVRKPSPTPAPSKPAPASPPWGWIAGGAVALYAAYRLGARS